MTRKQRPPARKATASVSKGLADSMLHARPTQEQLAAYLRLVARQLRFSDAVVLQ